MAERVANQVEVEPCFVAVLIGWAQGKSFMRNGSGILHEFQSVHWPSWLNRTLVSPFFMTDFWLNVNSPNGHCPDELRPAG